MTARSECSADRAEHPKGCACDRCQGRPLSRSRKPAGNGDDDIEARLKGTRQEIVDYIDSGANRGRVVGIPQGALEDWFDNLEAVSCLIRAVPQPTGTAAYWEERHDLVLRKHIECCGQVGAATREALEIAEDVLSRSPYSTAIWPNGMHPNTGIEKIRAALSLTRPDRQP